jgi:HK97 family phage portal protein
MSIWNNIYKAVFGPPAKDPAGASFIGTARERFNLGGTSDFETWVDEAFKQNETVNGALMLISSAVCEAPLKAYDPESDEPLPKSAIQQLLQHINPIDTQKQFIKELILHMYLGDIGYIEKVRDRKGRVTELRLLRPDLISVDADPREFITGYIYRVENKEFRLPAQDVIRIPFIDPINKFYGFSPLKALARRIDADTEATNHMMRLLQNRGQPGIAITIPEQITREEKQDLVRMWNARYRGQNFGDTAVLDGNMTVESIGYDLNQLDFTNQVNLFESKILAALRIPPPVYQSVSGQSNSTYNNMREANKQFWSQCIRPLMGMIEDVLNADMDLTENGLTSIRFDLSGVEALQEEQDAKSLRARDDFQAGVITLNEARLCGGFDEVPEGDQFKRDFAPDMSGLFGSDEEEPEEEEPEEEEKSESSDEVEIDAEDLLDLIDKRVLKALDGQNDPSETISTTKDEMPVEADSVSSKGINDILARQLSLALARASLADKYLARTMRMASKHLQKQLKDAEKLLGSKEKHSLKSFDESSMRRQLQELSDAWKEALAEDAQGILGDVMGRSIISSAKGVGVDIAIDSDAVTRAIRSSVYKFADRVATVSHKKLQGVFDLAREEGLSIRETKNHIRALSDQWDDVRATMIARTETTRFVHKGAIEGYQASGVVQAMQWSAILDQSTSGICNELDGKIVALTDAFVNVGDPTESKINLDYTGGGVEYPPAHPNCRSTVLPITVQGASEDTPHAFSQKELDQVREYKDERQATKGDGASGQPNCEECCEGH